MSRLTGFPEPVMSVEKPIPAQRTKFGVVSDEDRETLKKFILETVDIKLRKALKKLCLDQEKAPNLNKILSNKDLAAPESHENQNGSNQSLRLKNSSENIDNFLRSENVNNETKSLNSDDYKTQQKFENSKLLNDSNGTMAQINIMREALSPVIHVPMDVQIARPKSYTVLPRFLLHAFK